MGGRKKQTSGEEGGSQSPSGKSWISIQMSDLNQDLNKT